MRPSNSTWTYNLRDCLATARIDEQLDRDLRDDGLVHFYADHVHPLFQALYNLQSRGIMVDLDRHSMLQSQYYEKIEELQFLLSEFTGRKVTNPGSRDEWRKFLYEDLGLKPKALTKVKKIPQLTKLVLFQHIAFDELPEEIEQLCRLLVKWFEWRHIKAAFLDNLYVHHDERVRSSWKGTGSRTGRPTSSRPDLQNIPKRKHNIRSMYRAAPGKVLVNCDAKQMEMYLIALASGATKLIKMIEEDVDVHSYNAYLADGTATGLEDIATIKRLMENKGKAAEDRRDPAKSYWYAWEFGAGDATIAVTILEETEGEIVLTSEQIANLRKVIQGAYPEIPRWWGDVRAKARQQMSVVNEWGRPRLLFAGDTHGVPPNTIIQSTGADWVNGILIEVDKMTMSGQRRGQVIHHGWDSLLDETPDEHESIKVFSEAFAKPIEVFGYTVSMPYGISRGPYWGELEDV
jgi:DNA polymerase I-like protein with 3'-5' exonuclease and polymerase domains